MSLGSVFRQPRNVQHECSASASKTTTTTVVYTLKWTRWRSHCRKFLVYAVFRCEGWPLVSRLIFFLPDSCTTTVVGTRSGGSPSEAASPADSLSARFKTRLPPGPRPMASTSMAIKRKPWKNSPLQLLVSALSGNWCLLAGQGDLVPRGHLIIPPPVKSRIRRGGETSQYIFDNLKFEYVQCASCHP